MSCKSLKDVLINETECKECPAGLGRKIGIGWFTDDMKPRILSEFELDELDKLPRADNKDGFPISLPFNEKASAMMSEIAEQVRKGNKVENLRVIIEPDGPRLDPETMI